MEHVTLAPRRPSVVHEHGRLTIAIQAKYHRYITVLLGAWLAVWLVAETVLILTLAGVLRGKLAEMAPPRPALIFLLGLFTLAGAFIAWRLLWVLRGREILTLTSSYLLLRRAIGGLGRTHKYPLSELSGLRTGSFRREPVYPSWGRMFLGKGDAFVSFRHQGTDHHCARGLDPAEAQYVVEMISGRIPGKENLP